MSSSISALNAAVLRLMRPLCRLMLRNGMPFSAFEELAKTAYVQMAMNEFAIPGKKSTVSRASVLTGLTRKEVQRLYKADSVKGAADESYNRAVQVLTGWVRDSEFHDAQGMPERLTISEGPRSFAALVRRYSGDMPVRAVLDELLRVNAIARADDGTIELLNRAFIPSGDEAAKLNILGNDVHDLIDTIDHNICHGTQDPRFQRKVMYYNYPIQHAKAFRKLSADKAQQLLESLDKWLVEQTHDDQATSERQPSTKRIRLGMGIYYFEQETSISE